MNLDVEAYIKALENEYYLDILFSNKRNLKVRCFRAESFSGYFNCFVKYILLFFSIPLFLFFTRLTLPKGVKDNAFFICSDKSKRIFSNTNSDNHFGLFDDGIKFKFNLIDTYYFVLLVFAFVKKFKFSFWFYPEIMLIPEMIKVNRFLEHSKIKELNITNQYDRWAYFLSSLNLGYKINIEQHGIVSNDYIPKNKINIINKLTCYNVEQLDIFKLNIAKKIGSFIIRPPLLSLYPDLGDSSVLLCCTSNKDYFNKEKALYVTLGKYRKIKLAIKPHPNNKEYYSRFENVFVDDDFPKVKIVVHFNSTLELEYKNSDPDVITFNAATMKIAEVVESILRTVK
ncbi:hypothetical protein [Vibrio rumoiensis]|uniref:hypothetical protein n=1 Tax=Vibrio rumoiensis TaxID=76258 RepID=UPI003AA7B460